MYYIHTGRSFSSPLIKANSALLAFMFYFRLISDDRKWTMNEVNNEENNSFLIHVIYDVYGK